MKFAVCNETFFDSSISEGFRLANEIGYTGIELAPFTLSDDAINPLSDVNKLTANDRNRIKECAAENSLEIIGLHWLFAKTQGLHLTSPEQEVRTRTSKYLAGLVELCADLGGCVMVLGSPDQRNLLPGVSYDQAEDFAIEVIESALPLMEDRGVTLALEPLGPTEGDFINTAQSAVEIIERIGSKHCQLHLDVKAMASESLPIPSIIKQNKDHLAHFHANDPNLLGPGMGDVDFNPIADVLREIEYDRWISVEVFRYEPSPQEIARTSLANLNSLFA